MNSPPLTCRFCGHTGEDVEPYEGPYSQNGPEPFCIDQKACVARRVANDRRGRRGVKA